MKKTKKQRSEGKSNVPPEPKQPAMPQTPQELVVALKERFDFPINVFSREQLEARRQAGMELEAWSGVPRKSPKPIRIRTATEEDYKKLDFWNVDTFHRVSLPAADPPGRETKVRHTVTEKPGKDRD